jgi:hypothetical protein
MAQPNNVYARRRIVLRTRLASQWSCHLTAGPSAEGNDKYDNSVASVSKHEISEQMRVRENGMKATGSTSQT